jgi:hypothetical protein
MKNTYSNIGNLITIKKHGRGATKFYEVRYTLDGSVKPVFCGDYTSAIGVRADNLRSLYFKFKNDLPLSLTSLSV